MSYFKTFCTDCEIPLIRKIKRTAVCRNCSSKRGESKRSRSFYLKEYRKNNRKSWKKASKKAISKYIKTSKGKATRAAYEAARRARLKHALPSWANLNKIKEFYSNCPKGFEVDHIIPIKGENVCGLHVLENLQYLSASENKKKGNRI